MTDDPRELIDARADWNLRNWVRWQRGFAYSVGYPSKSAGLDSGGSGSADAFDHMCQEVDEKVARVSDSVIDELHYVDRCAIFSVYCQTIHQHDLSRFIDAVSEFWRKGQIKGLT